MGKQAKSAGVSVKGEGEKLAFIPGYDDMPEFQQAWMLGLAIAAIDCQEKGLEMFDTWEAGEYLAVPREPKDAKDSALLLWADARCALVEECQRRGYPAKDAKAMRALAEARRSPEDAVAALLALNNTDSCDPAAMN
ncbi:MAG: hypothetical protein HY901_14805 [Deltaproteobacteria bacterium]|nr:hypothetical protein [Deltaproteobacteria bacterium]